jgi:F-type H+-transporting ATPase subunit b
MLAAILAAEGPNKWLLPGAINEVYWASSAFLVLVILFLWKGLAPLKKALNARTERIAAELAEAEAAATAATQKVQTLKTELGNADSAAEQIRQDALTRAAQVKADLMARAETEVAESVQRARIEVEASKSQAFADLSAEVSALTLKATEAVVDDSLDDAARADLIEQYIAQVGAGR